MKMTAAVMRVQGRPRPYAVSQPMTIETASFDPPGPGEVLDKIKDLCGGVVTFDQISEGFDKRADGAVPRQVLRPHA